MDGEGRRWKHPHVSAGRSPRRIGRSCRPRPPPQAPASPRQTSRPRGVRERTLLPRAPRSGAGGGNAFVAGRRASLRHRAHLRVPLPERAHVRGLPEDERIARGDLLDRAARVRSRSSSFRWPCTSRDRASTRPTTERAASERGKRVSAAATTRPTSRRATRARATKHRRQRIWRHGFGRRGIRWQEAGSEVGLPAYRQERRLSAVIRKT